MFFEDFSRVPSHLTPSCKGITRKELEMIFKVMFVSITVLRSESIEMLMAQKLPAEEKSTREQLKALCVKLLSLVSCHCSFGLKPAMYLGNL